MANKLRIEHPSSELLLTRLPSDHTQPSCLTRVWGCFSKTMSLLVACLKRIFCCHRSDSATSGTGKKMTSDRISKEVATKQPIQPTVTQLQLSANSKESIAEEIITEEHP